MKIKRTLLIFITVIIHNILGKEYLKTLHIFFDNLFSDNHFGFREGLIFEPILEIFAHNLQSVFYTIVPLMAF